jgi:spore germination cell wall hydrolase CwlJ-like protein/outer membrane murein-binding lipoprotein Lpp
MHTGKKHAKIVYRGAALVLSAVFLFGGITAGRIFPLADSVQDLEQQQEQAQKDAEALEAAKKKLSDSLASMDMELLDLSNDVNDLEEEISRTETEIAEAEAALLDMQEDAEKQYDDMKLRIQYMYENGGTFSWTSIFSAKSFAEVLNRAEYALELMSTDRRLLAQYKDTLQQMEDERTALEEKRSELLLAKEKLDEKKEVLLASIETAQSDMDETDAQLAEKNADLSDIADQIAAMEEYERKLEEQKAKEAAEEQARIKAEEEAKRKAEEEAKRKEEEEAAGQEGSGSGEGDNADDSTASTPSSNGYYLHTTTPVQVSAEEEELFAAIIYCEAGGESYEGQFAVASVVVNRINSPLFPNNMTDVIYQKGQFTPAASGRLAVALERGLATESCRKAAKEALAGNICGDWLFFCVNNGTIDGTVIGAGVFY